MGVFDFVKEAGKKVDMFTNLAQEVNELGIEVENLDVQYNDGVAVVNGTVDSQADKEKIILALGNVDGVVQVDDSMEVRNPEGEATFYMVQPGDSLSKIAKRHYGDAMKYMAIFEANKPMLTSPDKIYPGQVLRIPAL
jgi:nucleoid-associated protein YgaU